MTTIMKTPCRYPGISKRIKLCIWLAIACGLGALINAGVNRFTNAETVVSDFKVSQKKESELREQMRSLDLKMGAECNNPDFFAPDSGLRKKKIEECSAIVGHLLTINRQTNSKNIARLGAIWTYKLDNYVSTTDDELHDYLVQRNGWKFYDPTFKPEKYLRANDPTGKLYDSYMNENLRFARVQAAFSYPEKDDSQIPKDKLQQK